MITDILSRVRRKTENKVDAALLGNPPSPVNLSLGDYPCWLPAFLGAFLGASPAQQGAVPCRSLLGAGQGSHHVGNLF